MSETRSVETTAPDIEEAIEAGLKQLDVSRESVIVEILEEPSRGILGLGSKFARVRLTTAARPYSEMAATTIKKEAPPRKQPVYQPPSREEDEDDFEFEDEDEGEDYASPNVIPLDESEWTEELKAGKETLETILRFMEVDADIEVEATEHAQEEAPTYVLHVHGDELSTLIGRRGNTLAALQYLTRLIASRNLQKRADFTVDVDGYKAKRIDRLHKIAHQMANQAVDHNRVMKLKPMPAHERRIIHMALRNRNDVTTRSQGEGKFRRVTIIPQKD
ncbi:MAG: Jag N-terminal domain-containing protein [Anaerolineae bacterium]|nr:Jag N-terminal domain-containing protein [Anaerolineae bacterium]